MSWAADEFHALDLGDQRLNRRTVLLAERLGKLMRVAVVPKVVDL